MSRTWDNEIQNIGENKRREEALGAHLTSQGRNKKQSYAVKYNRNSGRDNAKGPSSTPELFV